MNKISKFAAIGLLTLSGISLALPAHAIPSLRLTTGGASVTIEDGDANDERAEAGVVAYGQGIGDFFLTSSIGITKPVLGSPNAPSLDLLSVQVSASSSTSSIVVEFSDSDFFADGPTVSLPSLIGETANGTLRYQTFASLSNDEFAKDILISDSGVFQPGAFAFQDYATIALAGEYSLTAVITITHGASIVNSSFNATVEIAEPGLISMISLSGLLFAAGISTRRRQNRR